uniref:Uncharacterized protein n=1 Tax=Panagrolaimus superbus TaxID=310955 RepID=A0A914Y521_9BILA
MPYLTHEVQTVEIQNQKPIFTRVKPQLLIGQDYFWEMVIGNPKQLDNGFFELETIFGPLLCGKREKTAAEQFESSVNTIQTSEIKEFDISQFWSLEGIGITEDVTSTDDQKAKEHFKKTVTRAEDGRYIVRFPVKDTLQDLHNNYHLSFKRLQQTFHRLKKIQDVTLLPKYNKIFLDQLEKMMIEEVSESTPTGPYVHYLPHHPVITPDKATTKLRIVYDGSAKTPNGKCLNDYLLRGPVLLPDLCGTLLRFRTPKLSSQVTSKKHSYKWNFILMIVILPAFYGSKIYQNHLQLIMCKPSDLHVFPLESSAVQAYCHR